MIFASFQTYQAGYLHLQIMTYLKLLVLTLVLANVVLSIPTGTNPTTSIPFAKRVNRESLKGIAERDRARARSLKSKSRQLDRRAFSIPATNEETIYIASVGVGNPATQYNLIVDTGSSNTWIGAGTPYVLTDTSVNTGATVAVDYGSGSFSGEEFLDQLTLGAMIIKNQSIGVAEVASGFEGVDGILGLGPEILTEGTLNGGADSEIPTVMDNLVSQGMIASNLFALSFEPSEEPVTKNGEITFGGIDSSKFIGAIEWFPFPDDEFYSATWVSASLGSSVVASTSTVGILDAGTTLSLYNEGLFGCG